MQEGSCINTETRVSIGVRSCICSGMKAAELVDEQLEVALHQVWEATEHEIFRGQSAQMHPLSEDDQDFLAAELNRAKGILYSVRHVRRRSSAES